jgi:hypothetical protein
MAWHKPQNCDGQYVDAHVDDLNAEDHEGPRLSNAFSDESAQSSQSGSEKGKLRAQRPQKLRNKKLYTTSSSDGSQSSLQNYTLQQQTHEGSQRSSPSLLATEEIRRTLRIHSQQMASNIRRLARDDDQRHFHEKAESGHEADDLQPEHGPAGSAGYDDRARSSNPVREDPVQHIQRLLNAIAEQEEKFQQRSDETDISLENVEACWEAHQRQLARNHRHKRVFDLAMAQVRETQGGVQPLSEKIYGTAACLSAMLRCPEERHAQHTDSLINLFTQLPYHEETGASRSSQDHSRPSGAMRASRRPSEYRTVY